MTTTANNDVDDEGRKRQQQQQQSTRFNRGIKRIKKTSFVTNIFGVVIFVLFAEFLAIMLLHSLQYACLFCVYAFSVLLVFALFYGLSSLEK